MVFLYIWLCKIFVNFVALGYRLGLGLSTVTGGTRADRDYYLRQSQ
jgi:hypothetical protein